MQEPFQICSRCRRCGLECRIDSAFRRIGKRKKNAEMEREIVELRHQLAGQQNSPTVQQGLLSSFRVNGLTTSTGAPQLPSSLDLYMGSQDAVASLLDLKSGLEGGSFMRSPNGQARPSRCLEDVILTDDRIQELFNLCVLNSDGSVMLTDPVSFFTYYHPFLPILEPDKSPETYYETSPLLFWTIIAVAARRHPYTPIRSLAGPVTRLLWATVADVPQSYHVAKSLCLLCTWPLPISSTSADPTLMISGLMMQIAMQIGLHRPSHAQDFSKFKVELREEELRDRVKTWAACNVVAQR